MPRSDEMDAWIRDRRRLDALVGTQLLDTPAEESFDRLTRLAAKLVKVPATFITLVDEQRDFYKSCFGVGESRTFRRELEGRSFCHYTLVSSGPMLINDTLAETIFREVPEVEALGVRAYAGIPLITDSGQALGSFCAVDFVPREWSSLDVEILTELADSALREIKLRLAVAEAEKLTRVAQEAVRSREQVLAVVAHDLRTPLGFFKMGAQLLAEDSAGENRELLGRMEGAVDLMAHLIEDLLEVAKIEAVGVTIHARPIPAETLLDDALSMLKPLAERHSITLVTSAEPALPEVLVDYDRVLRVFSNLIVNAVKFSSPQSEVRVTAMRHGSFVRFSVIDAGQGIETGDQERLFERFWQADRADRRGAGLGLSIAKAIVAAHGGTIGVTSKVGKGSSFYFDLPAA